MKAINMFNHSPNRSSSRDHVFSCNILPPTTHPPAPAHSATPGGDIPHYMRYIPFHYRTQTGCSY